jgi:hypothetical protein
VVQGFQGEPDVLDVGVHADTHPIGDRVVHRGHKLGVEQPAAPVAGEKPHVAQQHRIGL